MKIYSDLSFAVLENGEEEEEEEGPFYKKMIFSFCDLKFCVHFDN